MKKINKSLLISSILCLFPILITIIFFRRIPEHIPLHFNYKGDANFYGSKSFLIIIPIILFILNIVIYLIRLKDTKNNNIPNKLSNILTFILPSISFIIVISIILISLNYNVKIEKIIPIFISVLLILLGMYLPKCKRNYTVGIKLPWTLYSDEIWLKTHKLSGILFIISGIFNILSSILFSKISIYIMLITLVIILITPTLYSFILYKKTYKA